MSFLKIKTDKDTIANFGGSSYIASSGIYPVTIKFASVDTTKNGAVQVNFNLDYNGNPQTIYGPYIKGTDGTQLEGGINMLRKLGIIVGLTDGDDLTTEEEEHAVGKDNTVKEFTVIQEFTDAPVQVWVQEEYSINPNTNEIQKRLVPKDFFREDGASPDEIVNETTVGDRLKLVTEKYASNVRYQNDLTAEDVETWKEAKAAKGGGGNAAPKAKSSGPKKAISFD